VLACLSGCATADSRADGGASRSDGAVLPDGGIPADAGPDAEPHGDITPVINEFVADHAGDDDCEYVEIAGAAGVDYARYTVLTVEGDAGNNPGQVQAVIPAGTASAEGYWSSGFLSPNTLQNGSSTILLVADFTGGTPDIDANNDGAIDNEPWSALADAVGVNDGGVTDVTYAAPATLTRTFDGADSVVGGASRIPDATDTDQPVDWTRNINNAAGLPCDAGGTSIGTAANTPGASNRTE
jgi:hypothetical protein